MILSEFIKNTKGTKVSLKNGGQKGQCVSLIQRYLEYCYNIPFKARGHAKDFGKSLVNEGLAYEVKEPVYGDIIVYSGSLSNLWYGHVAIFIDNNYMYDQNNSTHDKKASGYSKHLSGTRRYYRLYRVYKKGKYLLRKAKAIRSEHKLGEQYMIKVKYIMYDPYKKNDMLKYKDENDYAYINVGQTVDITEIYIDNTSRVWGKLKNCWIVLYNSNGEPQAEYIGG